MYVCTQSLSSLGQKCVGVRVNVPAETQPATRDLQPHTQRVMVAKRGYLTKKEIQNSH